MIWCGYNIRIYTIRYLYNRINDNNFLVVFIKHIFWDSIACCLVKSLQKRKKWEKISFSFAFIVFHLYLYFSANGLLELNVSLIFVTTNNTNYFNLLNINVAQAILVFYIVNTVIYICCVLFIGWKKNLYFIWIVEGICIHGNRYFLWILCIWINIFDVCGMELQNNISNE